MQTVCAEGTEAPPKQAEVVLKKTNDDAKLQAPPRRKDPADWPAVRRLLSKGENIAVEITEVNGSGAIFKICGVRGFLPYVLMDFKHLTSEPELVDTPLTYMVGKTVTVKLLTVKEKSRTVIASEQAILFQQFTKNLKKGDVVEGVVDFCTDYGAFVRLGAGESFRGVEGLIHISELSWNKIFKPEAVVHVGMFVRCILLSIDKEKGKISLSLKRMNPDPLLQRLDTVLPEDREQLAVVPTELPSSIEDIMGALLKQAGIDGVSLGRQAEERAVSQDLEIWLSSAKLENGFILVARTGRLVQEIKVNTGLSKEELKGVTQAVLKELA